ncbi:hypothetical protein [Frankia gtarii]|uniref:hypothetical protein n=1 Tax=Frankia gtarii TaxID=2950102 RepID=UPI003F6831CD
MLSGVAILAGRGRPALLAMVMAIYYALAMLRSSPGGRPVLLGHDWLSAPGMVLRSSPGADARRCRTPGRRPPPSRGCDPRRARTPGAAVLGQAAGDVGRAVAILAGRGRPALPSP